MESSAATHLRDRTTSVRSPFAIARPKARIRAVVLARWLALADIFASFLAGAAIGAIANLDAWNVAALAAITAVTWPTMSFVLGLYAPRTNLRSWASGVNEISRTLIAAVLFSWPLFAALTLVGAGNGGALMAAGVTITVSLSTIARAGVRARLHRETPLRQKAAVVGSGVVAGQLVSTLRTHSQFGIDPVGLIDENVHEIGSPDLPLLGRFEDLDKVIDHFGVDRVIIAFSRAGHEELLRCIRVCRDRGVVVDIVPRLFEFLDGARAVDHVGALPVISIGTPRLSRASRIAKRALDIVGSGLLTAILMPVLVAVAIAIKVESRGPILFSQPRVGRGHRMFNMFKFRSMYEDADQRKDDIADRNDVDDGVMFKVHSDPRVTKVGRLIRRLSLDELPQLFNVLTGDMSLVGPRPLIEPETDALYEDWHERRLELRPGMTGPWQIRGRSETPFQEMVRLDYQYVAGWSLARDVEILLGTLPAVLSGRGAY